MARKYFYQETGRGVGLDGWYKITLRRSDGKEVRVSKKRFSHLLQEHQIVEISKGETPCDGCDKSDCAKCFDYKKFKPRPTDRPAKGDR